jgi:hypothetical protein
MKKLINSMFLVTLLYFVGCAHSMMRGSVAMKMSDNEAHVCLGNKEVKVGDRVTALKNYCSASGAARKEGASAVCEKRILGEGTVTSLLNQHYSLVKFDDGVKFNEGTIVEKNN